MITSYREYTAEKREFFNKHDSLWACETSSMDNYGVYYKEYIFADGAIWSERMSPAFEQIHAEVKKVDVRKEVKMLRTEYWTTESQSKYCYELF